MKKSEKEVSFAKVLQDQSWAEEEEEALELPFCFASNSTSMSGRFKRLGFVASWDDKKALELPSVLLPTVASISSSRSFKRWGFAGSSAEEAALELPYVLLATVASISSSSSSSKQELQKRDGDAAKKKDTNP
jgi:hypothetical protein